jgi:hypothetical protein
VTTKRTFWAIFGLVFIWLMFISLVSITLLIIAVEQMVKNGRAVPDFIQVFMTLLKTWQDGNESTGVLTAWFFSVSMVPVGIKLISRIITRCDRIGEKIKGFFRRVNNFQGKYLMQFHTYLSILGLGFGILHLKLSTCAINPLPEWGLILSGILVITGMFFKWKAIPPKFRNFLYKFHTSLIVSGVLLTILIIGHAVMEVD